MIMYSLVVNRRLSLTNTFEQRCFRKRLNCIHFWCYTAGQNIISDLLVYRWFISRKFYLHAKIENAMDQETVYWGPSPAQ